MLFVTFLLASIGGILEHAHVLVCRAGPGNNSGDGQTVSVPDCYRACTLAFGPGSVDNISKCQHACMAKSHVQPALDPWGESE